MGGAAAAGATTAAAKAGIGVTTAAGTNIAYPGAAAGYTGFAGTSALATVGIAAFLALWAYKFVSWIKGKDVLPPEAKARLEAAAAAGTLRTTVKASSLRQ